MSLSLRLCKESRVADAIEQISSSIDVLTQEFNIIAHNLANVSTVGYKRRCNSFSQSLEEQKAGTQNISSSGIDLNSTFDFSQGSIVETARPLDFALYGKGFFLIETPEGPLYTRNGIFQANQNGQIVDSQGRIVAGEAGPISIPNNIAMSEFNVTNDGSISTGGVAIGKFRLVDFQDDENKLIPIGDSCYRMPDEDIQPAAAENLVVKQGYQEASNVKIIDELVDMIMVSRLYEANMKYISARKDASSSLMSVAMG
jgi:flagellar basal-body rod protein FlgF